MTETHTANTAVALPPLTLYLAEPRGFCAGVDRAIKIVEQALQKWGAPVYVRHEIVHNAHVVNALKAQGVVFVDDLQQCPTHRPVIFSAHGVAKSVIDNARNRKMMFIDATCPLVSKVHNIAIHHYKNGTHVIMIGHANHPEVIGTMGQVPKGALTLVETVADVAQIRVPNGKKLAFITQTTLSMDDTKAIISALRDRFPSISGQPIDSICYATTNRQNAVKAFANKIDALLVVGSKNSSNTHRLLEVAKHAGCPQAQRIDNAEDIAWNNLTTCTRVGITSGASAPEILVQRVISAFKERYCVSVETVVVNSENVAFKVPASVRV